MVTTVILSGLFLCSIGNIALKFSEFNGNLHRISEKFHRIFLILTRPANGWRVNSFHSHILSGILNSFFTTYLVSGQLLFKYERILSGMNISPFTKQNLIKIIAATVQKPFRHNDISFAA